MVKLLFRVRVRVSFKGHAKYIRHAGECGQDCMAHSPAVLTRPVIRTVNEVYAVPSRRPISFCSCRLLFHMFLSILAPL